MERERGLKFLLYFVRQIEKILKEVAIVARCPKLTAVDGGLLSSISEYQCDLTGLKMDADGPKVKFVCNCDSGYEYEKCPIYQVR